MEAEIVRHRIDRGGPTKVLWNAAEYIRVFRVVREHRSLQTHRTGRSCFRASRYRSMDFVAPEYNCRRVHRSDGQLRPDARRAPGEQFHDRAAFQLVCTAESPAFLER